MIYILCIQCPKANKAHSNRFRNMCVCMCILLSYIQGNHTNGKMNSICLVVKNTEQGSVVFGTGIDRYLNGHTQG
jgi:hypothetical protein